MQGRRIGAAFGGLRAIGRGAGATRGACWILSVSETVGSIGTDQTW